MSSVPFVAKLPICVHLRKSADNQSHPFFDRINRINQDCCLSAVAAQTNQCPWFNPVKAYPSCLKTLLLPASLIQPHKAQNSQRTIAAFFWAFCAFCGQTPNLRYLRKAADNQSHPFFDRINRINQDCCLPAVAALQPKKASRLLDLRACFQIVSFGCTHSCV